MAWVIIANLKGAPGDVQGLQILQQVLDALALVPANRGSADGKNLDNLYVPADHAGNWDVWSNGGAYPLPENFSGRGNLAVDASTEFAAIQRLVSRTTGDTWVRRGLDTTVTPPRWSGWVQQAADNESVLRLEDPGTPRTLLATQADYVDIKLSRDYRRVEACPNVIASNARVIESVLPYSNGDTVNLSNDYRMMQPGAVDGAFTPQVVLDEWASRMSMGVGFTQLVGWGDSMTTNFGTPGVTSIGKIAAELGVTGIDQGRSGNTPVEIAWRMGAWAWRVTVTNDSIPASGAVAATLDQGPGFYNAFTWDCTIADRNGVARSVRLVCSGVAMGGTPTWTIEQLGGTAAITILPGTRIKWVRPVGQELLPCTVWLGRNDSLVDPGSVDRARRAIRAMIEEHRDPLGRMIVLPMWNRATSPAGSAQYILDMKMNEAMQEEAGELWYDLRAAIIKNGLDIVGVAPTPEDTTAIAEDRVPPSLMSDVTHPNELGKTAIGRLVANEIKGRNW